MGKYRVQEIEKITGINRKQLYEYDILGIVKPIVVDENNGYKYYDDDQVSLLALVALLVELGYTPKALKKKIKDENFNIQDEIKHTITEIDRQIAHLKEVRKSAEEILNVGLPKVYNGNKSIINTDEIVSKISALGIPGLVLIISMSATGMAGAAAITTALSALGPFGILGGIATLGITGLVSEGIAKYGLDSIFKSVITELEKKGENRETIKAKIEKYPISKELKLKLFEHLGR